LFGYAGAGPCTAGQLWQHLCRSTCVQSDLSSPSWAGALRTILRRGPLARRILRALGGDTSHGRLREVYGRLCDCLAEGRMFAGE